jgi:hypothetical protein
VLAAERPGPYIRLRVQLEDGEVLESVTTELDHPAPGDAVRVEVDPAGIVPFRR